MLKSIKIAGLALAAAMACSCAVRAQGPYRYDDGYARAYADGLRIARSTGYEDGLRMGYHDLNHYKRFNPYPRGKFRNEDHGYHHEYGDKYAYREEYARGYGAGYQSAFRR